MKMVILSLLLVACSAANNSKNKDKIKDKTETEFDYGAYQSFSYEPTAAALTSSMSDIDDISPIHEFYQSINNLLSRGYGFSPLIKAHATLENKYIVEPDDHFTRREFLQIMNKVIFENFIFNYENGSKQVFHCENENNASLIGATISDLNSNDSSFRLIQCLVDNGFHEVPGFLNDTNQIRLNDTITAGEAMAVLSYILESWQTQIQDLSQNHCAVASNFNFKKFLKQLFAQLQLIPSAQAQLTSVTQISDLAPESPYYQSISYLIEAWGVSGYVYPDGTAQLDGSMTKGRFLSTLNEANDRLIEASTYYVCD